MKILIQFVIVILCAWLVIWLDTLLYDYIVNLIPNGNWKGLLKFIIVVLMVIYTSGIVIWLTVLASTIALLILNIVLPDKPISRWTTPKKSKFQERCDELRRESLKKKKE